MADIRPTGHRPYRGKTRSDNPASVQDFAERLQGARTLDGVWKVIEDGYSAFGIDHIVYMFMRPSAPDDNPLVRSNLPTWWSDYYLDAGRARHDPFFKTCRTFSLMRTGAEFLDDHRDILTDPERNFIREASEIGMLSGISSPVRLENPGHYGGWNLGNRMRRPEFERYVADYRETLQLMGFFAHEALQTRSLAVPVKAGSWNRGGLRLSSRERECLLWLCRGMRNAEIADRLNIATVTVELHFRRIRAKLGAATREEALAKAILSGEIVP